MPERAQLVELRRQAGLERHAPPRVDPEARRVERALRVEAAVDERVHELEVALRLHRAAHHAERAPQLAVAEQEPGDDRVERPLPRPQPVRMSRLRREAPRPVLEHDPRVAREHAGAPVVVGRLDQRDGVAVAVDHAEVGRAAARRPRGLRLERAVGHDERTPRSQVLRIEQKRGQRRIRDLTVGVGERELRRLDPAVQRVGQPVEQAERDQRGRALAVRR